MNNSLFNVVEIIQTDSKFLTVCAEGFDLLTGNRVGDGFIAVGSGNVVILNGHNAIRMANAASGHPQSLKRLRTRYFVTKQLIDVNNRGIVARLLINKVIFPDFIIHRFGSLRAFERFLRHFNLVNVFSRVLFNLSLPGKTDKTVQLGLNILTLFTCPSSAKTGRRAAWQDPTSLKNRDKRPSLSKTAIQEN